MIRIIILFSSLYIQTSFAEMELLETPIETLQTKEQEDEYERNNPVDTEEEEEVYTGISFYGSCNPMVNPPRRVTLVIPSLGT